MEWGNELKEELLASLFVLLREVLDIQPTSSTWPNINNPSGSSSVSDSVSMLSAVLSVAISEGLLLVDSDDDHGLGVGVVGRELDEGLSALVVDQLSDVINDDGSGSDGGGAPDSLSSLSGALAACDEVISCLNHAASHIAPFLPPTLNFMQRYAAATHRAVTEVN